MRAGACVGTRRSPILKGCWGSARPAIEPANRSGYADAHIPYPRLFGGANAPGEPLALLRVLDLRHVRLVAADVQKQLDHCRERLAILVPATDITGIRQMRHKHVVHLFHPVHGIDQRPAPPRGNAIIFG